MPNTNSAHNTVECRYNTMQYIMILHTTIQWQEQNMNQISKSHKTPHPISRPYERYGMSVVRILQKIDRVMMAPSVSWIVSSPQNFFDIFVSFLPTKGRHHIVFPSRQDIWCLRWFELFLKKMPHIWTLRVSYRTLVVSIWEKTDYIQNMLGHDQCFLNNDLWPICLVF